MKDKGYFHFFQGNNTLAIYRYTDVYRSPCASPASETTQERQRERQNEEIINEEKD